MIRNYRSSDLELLLKLIQPRHWRTDCYPAVSEAMLLEYLDHPRVHPEKDCLVAENGSEIGGFITVFTEKALGRALLNCVVHPDQPHLGVGRALIDRALRRAAQAGVKAAQANLAKGDARAQERYRSSHFQYIRDFYEFQLDMDKGSLSNVKPNDCLIRQMQPGETERLTNLQNRCFDGSWGFNPNTPDEIRYRLNLNGYAFQDIHIAFKGDQPIAYCWMRAHRAAAPKAQIHMMGVHPGFRGSGLGRRILQASLAATAAKGFNLVELTVDAENPAGLALYQRMGFRKINTTHWYEKRL